jgi:hypothetical protein
MSIERNGWVRGANCLRKYASVIKEFPGAEALARLMEGDADYLEAQELVDPVEDERDEAVALLRDFAEPQALIEHNPDEGDACLACGSPCRLGEETHSLGCAVLAARAFLSRLDGGAK